MIALLPMKAHSERVPSKNIKNFNGKPLYHYVLLSLAKSNLIDRILINTDSKLIEKESIELSDKVSVVLRPTNLLGDFVEMNKIIEYDMNQVEGEHFFQTHSTNPLLKTDTIDRAINRYYQDLDLFDSLFSVNKLQSRFYDKNFVPINHRYGELKRTQDLDPIYEENSNIYIFSKKSFLKNNFNRIGKKPQAFLMDSVESIDIDTKDEFVMAEKLQKLG